MCGDQKSAAQPALIFSCRMKSAGSAAVPTPRAGTSLARAELEDQAIDDRPQHAQQLRLRSATSTVRARSARKCAGRCPDIRRGQRRKAWIGEGEAHALCHTSSASARRFERSAAAAQGPPMRRVTKVARGVDKVAAHSAARLTGCDRRAPTLHRWTAARASAAAGVARRRTSCVERLMNGERTVTHDAMPIAGRVAGIAARDLRDERALAREVQQAIDRTRRRRPARPTGLCSGAGCVRWWRDRSAVHAS